MGKWTEFANGTYRQNADGSVEQMIEGFVIPVGQVSRVEWDENDEFWNGYLEARADTGAKVKPRRKKGGKGKGG